ncbi:MAG: ZIP family metal transporter [Clostridia bacterium]|nr:ZIP family metal transporter [Clostridia bacterium]
MEMVLLTALGVGGATVVGALIGFIFKKTSHRFSDIVLAFAAGVMLAAAVLGLVMPSVEYGYAMFAPTPEESASPVVAKILALSMTVAGIFVGALCLNLVDRLVPHLHKIADTDQEVHPESRNVGKVLLFVMAIAIHNLPEGIAAGVGFGSGNTAEALLIAGGIALQNIPEGMVIIAPMLAAGIKPGRTFIIALGTGLVEIVGTLLGYFSVTVSTAILPFALAFAGGTMLYIISDEMIPETHAHGSERGATYALLVGFCVMLVSDILLG